jgi:5-methylcytosine-specific restriction endonuclease McrA
MTGTLFIAKSNTIKINPKVWTISPAGNKYIKRPKITLSCEHCGIGFKSSNKPRKITLCRPCGEKEWNRLNKAKRRAAERGNKYESLSPYFVFKRDKWHCRCCGAHTPWSLRGSIEPNAPELDHIIPLSKGGEHSYANTQLLCRKCNQEKSDTIDIHTIKKAKFQYEIFYQYGRVGR